MRDAKSPNTALLAVNNAEKTKQECGAHHKAKSEKEMDGTEKQGGNNDCSELCVFCRNDLRYPLVYQRTSKYFLHDNGNRI